MATQKKRTVDIVIPALSIDTIALRLIGISPLVVNNAKGVVDKLLRDQDVKGITKEPRPGGKKNRPQRDPKAEYLRSRYIVDAKTDGFPAFRVKEALVFTAFTFADVARTLVKGALFVRAPYHDHLVRIESDCYPPKMNLGTERVGSKVPGEGAPDLRWRAEYTNWSIPIEIEYESNLLSVSQVVNLVAKAGFHCGIGEHRPQKQGGTWGRFSVMLEEEYQKKRKIEGKRTRKAA